MKAVFYTGKFRKDFKLAIKRGLNMSLIQIVMKDLENRNFLDPKYKEHLLTGNYIGFSECHIQPNWLLIHLREPEQITFVRIGTHADLF